MPWFFAPAVYLHTFDLGSTCKVTRHINVLLLSSQREVKLWYLAYRENRNDNGIVQKDHLIRVQKDNDLTWKHLDSLDKGFSKEGDCTEILMSSKNISKICIYSIV